MERKGSWGISHAPLLRFFVVLEDRRLLMLSGENLFEEENRRWKIDLALSAAAAAEVQSTGLQDLVAGRLFEGREKSALRITYSIHRTRGRTEEGQKIWGCVQPTKGAGIAEVSSDISGPFSSYAQFSFSDAPLPFALDPFSEHSYLRNQHLEMGSPRCIWWNNSMIFEDENRELISLFRGAQEKKISRERKKWAQKSQN